MVKIKGELEFVIISVDWNSFQHNFILSIKQGCQCLTQWFYDKKAVEHYHHYFISQNP